MKVNNAMETNGYLESRISYMDLTDNKLRKKVVSRADYSDSVDISEEAKARYQIEHTNDGAGISGKPVLSGDMLNEIMKHGAGDSLDASRAEKVMNLKERINSGTYDFNKNLVLAETAENIISRLL